MSTLNIAALRFAQGLLGIFFIFVTSAYFGLLLLFPLAVLYHLTNAFTGMFGFEGIGGVVLALPLAAGAFYAGFKVPGLFNVFIDTGIALVKMAREHVLKFETLIQQQRGFTGGVSHNNAA